MTFGLALFTLALVFSWVNSALHVLLPHRPLYAFSASAAPSDPIPARRLVAVGLATLGFAAASGAWALSDWPRLGAAAVLLVLLSIRQVEKRQWPGNMVVRLGKYVPAAACLLGWLVAATLTRALSWEEAASQRAGWEAAAGVMAALYPLAALSKLRLTGWRWMRPQHHALMIAERAYTGPHWVRAIRQRGSRSMALCGFVGMFGLLSEFACALYVFPDARLFVTAIVLALHAGILLFLGYIEPEWILVMVGLTVMAF